MCRNNGCSQIIEQIKNEMKSKGISLRELSKISTLAPSTIYDILENKGSPRLATIQYICKALDLEIRVYKGDSYIEVDDLAEQMANLSKKKRESVKEFVKLLEPYNE